MKTLQLTVKNFAFGGDGAANLPDGKICFLPGAVPGDFVEVEILSEKKNFSRGKVLKILTPSPDRVEPFCPLRNAEMPCPGCVYAEITYDRELASKQEQFAFFLRSFDVKNLRPPFASPVQTAYRNKITLSCENGVAGYRAADNRTLLPVESCPLARKAIEDRMKTFHPSPEAVKTVFRWTLADGVTVTETPRVFPRDERFLTEQVGRFGRFFVPSDSFFQVNMAVAEELCSRVTKLLARHSPDFLLELYCGSGIFSVLAAETLPAIRCVGVELDPEAVRAATLNSKTRELSERCRFVHADALKFPALHGIDPDRMLLLADPPRTGMPKELLARIQEMGPRHVLYISCAPDMLRRDLSALSEAYRIEESGLLDMFPRTAHFETLTLLEHR